MNIMGRDKGEAKLHYLDGEYEIVSPGSFVLCAVTGTQIPSMLPVDEEFDGHE